MVPPTPAAPTSVEPDARPTEVQPTEFHLIAPVWGDAYLDRFLNYVLPSHLAALEHAGWAPREATYWLVTDARGRERVACHPAWAALRSRAAARLRTPGPARFLPGCWPPGAAEPAYLRMTRYYDRAMAEASRVTKGGPSRPSPAFLFLTAEGVVSENTFATIAERIERGADAVLVPGLRVEAEAACRALAPDGGGRVDRSGARLARLWLRDPHRLAREAFVDAGGGSGGDPLYHFAAGPEAALTHGFHWHPLLIRPRHPRARIPPRETVDDRFLQMAVDWPGVSCVASSAEAVLLDLTDAAHGVPPAEVRTPERVVAFAAEHGRGYHRALFGRPYLAAGPDADPTEITAARRRAAAWVDDIRRRLEDRDPSGFELLPYPLQRRGLAGWPARLRDRAAAVGWSRILGLRSRWQHFRAAETP